MKRIYLDYNATTPLDPKVYEEMCSCLQSNWGNPSSLHHSGRTAHTAVDTAREIIAQTIHAQPGEIVFTSGGTEANNLAIIGSLSAYEVGSGHIITSAIEHQSVLNPCKALEKQGFELSIVGVDSNGVVKLSDLEQLIRKDTKLISIMTANNDTGVIQPIREIAQIAKNRNILFHTDAVQAVGKIAIDVGSLGVDLLTFSGHKIYGPKGVGVLYRKRGVNLTPLIWGGNQERKLRSGTENVPAIHAMGIACSILQEDLIAEQIRLQQIRDSFELQLKEKIPSIIIASEKGPRVCNTSNILFRSISGEFLAMNLDIMGIDVSTGSACSSIDNEPSHVLASMGFNYADANSSIRFSFGRNTSPEDIDTIITHIEKAISLF